MVLNFRTISDLSSLSWEAYDHDLPLDELKKRYAVITTQPRMSRWVVLILVAFANAAFCRLFGGDWIAMGLVWMATLTGFFVRQELTVRKVNHMLIFIVCSFVASLVAALECTFFNPRSSFNQFYPGYPGRACPDRFFQGDQCRYLDYMYCLRVVDDFADPGKRSVVI